MSALSDAKQTKSAVREYFDADADGYLSAYTGTGPDEVRTTVFLERRELVMRMTPPRPGRVLDVGAGPGVFTRQLLERGASCAVVDVSLQMIAAARRQFPDALDAKFIVGDVDRLPFADGAFDVALCVGVLQYLSSPLLAIRELARVVSPGGRVVVTFPNERSPLNRLHSHTIRAVRRAAWLMKGRGAHGVSRSRLTFREDIPNRFLGAAEVESLAREAGLTTDEIVYHLLQFPFSIPGLGRAMAVWNRRVRGRFPRGRFAHWGREGIVRFTRT